MAKGKFCSLARNFAAHACKGYYVPIGHGSSQLQQFSWKNKLRYWKKSWNFVGVNEWELCYYLYCVWSDCVL